ncbi:gamma-glutamyl-gamma-aminobutyrate hydrolase family protein [Micrococcales bacterium 31B]|nr:gamma-glutamyl-gamma-aminobutyrate hydrolase family protein [Micrococcales bacterium 31B]
MTENSANRPIIALSMYRVPASWAGWLEREADLLTSTYARSVVAAGGLPVLLPASFTLPDARVVLSRVDGLVVCGGADVNPSRYGETPHETVTEWHEDRDASELALLAAAKEVGMPVLGICRGMQLMAVHAGGSLNQHIPEQLGHLHHSPGANLFGTTRVSIEGGTKIAGLLDREVSVQCHHHQSVKDAGPYRVTSASSDGVPESMEGTGERFELAVQWHPEQDRDVRLFEALVAAAGEFAGARQAS